MPPPTKQVKPDSFINKEISLSYWQNATADNNGMLGGIPAKLRDISRIDLSGSRTFLARLDIGIGLSRKRNKLESCAEAGAGIGRVTEGLLAAVAENIDVIEPVAKFTELLQDKPGVRSIYNVGLEAWQPAEGVRYDLIWTQWCLGYLTDDQVVKCLEVYKACLRPETGVIVVKENVDRGGQDVFDPQDSSVDRVDETWKSLFRRAGLRIIKEEPQRGLPEWLLPVMMFALKP